MGNLLGGVVDIVKMFYDPQTDKMVSAQEDLADAMRFGGSPYGNNLQPMFPFTEDLQTFARDLYGDGGFDAIQDYLEKPTRPTNLERQLFEFFGGQEPSRKGGGKQYKRYGAKQSGPLAGMGIPMLEETLGRLESLYPYGEDLARTGFRTDIGPAQDYALRLFEREMVPELTERFGSNITGSGYQNALFGTAGDVASQLGAMQVALDESAAARRLQALQPGGAVQSIFEGPLNKATEFATMGGQVGEAYKNAMDMARPGRGYLAALPMFVQGATSGGFIQPGYPTSGTDFGNLFSALGQTSGNIAGGIGQGIVDILRGWGSGGTSATGGVGTKTGMGWNMASMGGTDIGGAMPWLSNSPQPIVSSGWLF